MLDQKVDKVRYDRLIVIKFLSRCIIVFTVLVTMHIQYVEFVEPLCVASQGHLLSSQRVGNVRAYNIVDK